MAPIAVREVTTFYNMYNQQPVGKFKLNVCTNLPCQLRDGQKALEHLCTSWASKWAAPRPTACSPCSNANAWAPVPTRR
jgi:NADH:ubiquinone oxidoreductase subunit E